MYDVIIVGGGHSGIEAAYASSKMGAKTLLLTHNINNICEMSCNPSVGGSGKSHLVKEIDAMGGIISKNTDFAGIQFKKLHSMKGQISQFTRVQVDKFYYKFFMKHSIFRLPNLRIIQCIVNDIIIKNNKIIGIVTKQGAKIFGTTVIFSTGTQPHTER